MFFPNIACNNAVLTLDLKIYQKPLRSRSYQSVAVYRASPLPRWGIAPSKLPKYCYLSCSPLWPGGASAPSYQSVAAYCVPAPAQAGLAAPEGAKVLLLIVFPALPRWGSPSSTLLSRIAIYRSYQSIAICRVPAPVHSLLSQVMWKMKHAYA